MEYRILGPIEVRDGTHLHELGGLRERTLLCCLVLSANHVVSPDRLVENLWAGDPPPHSGATLRVYIARLRRALGAGAGALVTQPLGYRLNVAPGELDADQFVALADSARAELAAGDPEVAAAGLRTALALWRGPALADVADLAFAEAEAVRLEEARLTAVEDRISADLACGRHASVIAELDGLVVQHQLRERLYGLQLLAMYRCGRQADALASFEQLRHRLAEELGIDPGPKLRRLHEAILRQEPSLAWHPAAHRGGRQPGAVARDAGGQMPGAAAGREIDEPGSRIAAPAGSAAARLPAETTTFVGREAELDRVAEMLRLSRLVTLTGPSGAGKSRLALRAAARLAASYPDGVWLIQFASVARPEIVLAAMAQAWMVREDPGRPLLESMAAQRRDSIALLILDNCEHLLEPVAEAAGALLQSCPALRILATSQVRLSVDGEVSWPVPPLTVPAPGERDAAMVCRSESAQLFCDRAAQVRPDFIITPANSADVAEICRRLDGIPLALELAAARISVLTPSQLSARLDDRFRLLTGGSRTGLARHRTMWAALEWSHDLLTAAEQACFRRMAVFVGGCTIDAAEAVVPGGQLQASAVFETVTSLVERTLLTCQEQVGSMRYGMLESVRQYASLRLDEARERPAVSRRHAAWALSLARQADLDGPDQSAWLELLAVDHHNFVAALEWSLSGRDTGAVPAAESALALAAALAPFWKVRGYIALGQRWLDTALAAAGQRAGPRQRAAALDGAGQLAAVRADYDAQRAYQQESLAIWRGLGEDARVASVLSDLGSAAHTRAEYATSRAIYAEALALARSSGDAVQIARSLSGLGVLALHLGHLDTATTYFQEAMAQFREAGDIRRATLILGNLGVVAINLGDYTLAAARLDEHLATARKLGDRKLIAGSLTNLGMAVHHLGDLDRADALHREALELTEELGDRRISAVVLTNLGLVAFARHDFAAAATFHRRSLGLAEAVGEPRSIAEGLEELAATESAQRRMRRTAVLSGAAQAIRQQIGAPAPGPDLARYAQALDAAERALGSGPFSAAMAAGRALPMAAAVRFAMSDASAPVHYDEEIGMPAPAGDVTDSGPQSIARPPAVQ